MRHYCDNIETANEDSIARIEKEGACKNDQAITRRFHAKHEATFAAKQHLTALAYCLPRSCSSLVTARFR